MTYQDQWRAISARMQGLTRAGELYARFLSVRSSDSFRSSRLLKEQIEDLHASLQAFRDAFATTLPLLAMEAIKRFLLESRALTSLEGSSRDSEKEAVWAALVRLEAFESELSFILSDSQQAIRARSERAFSHLQRVIVVDQEFREKWQRAFKDGEVECEKLGAVHLLLHGIFPFKLNAARARTDLVYQDQSTVLSGETQFVDGLVLTEWKKASDTSKAGKEFEAARSQARLYAQGALAGHELTSYRFAVVITKHQVDVPNDVVEEGVVYRHINIAVDPLTPSQAKRTKRGTG